MNRLFLCSAVAVAFALGAPAIARGDETLSASAKAAAQPRYAKGLELYAEALRTHDPGTFESAYLEFVQAFSIYPDDKVLWNLAVSANDTNRVVEALHDFRAFNDHQHAVENPTHPQHALIVRYLDDLTKKTSHVDVDAPPGARIQLDGEPAGTAPLRGPVDMLPGTHELSANVSGTLSHARLEAVGGAHMTVRLGFVEVAPLPTSAAPIAVHVGPVGASSPDRDAGAPEGRSFFTVRNTALLGLGVGAVASVAAGIGFRIGANTNASTEKTLDAQGGSCPGSARCDAISQAANGRASDNNLATGFFVAGGALALTGVALFAFWHDAPSPSAGTALYVAPSVGPTTTGIQLAGTF